MRKQAKSVFEMIELLKQRGLTIDVPDMPGILLDNNYYRLSAYFRPFQKDPANGDNDFGLSKEKCVLSCVSMACR
ncbi:hypothetical protein [Bifidobacterium longum]|uniref:hypothetical protein n=1 Tax=Bifidobacterium longum TaxID=216816 RepID=UPI00080B6879|nr:hypothetical protein [Bifidobacterium longum]